LNHVEDSESNETRQPLSHGHGGSNWRQAGPVGSPLTMLQPVNPVGWPELVESKSMRGIGFMAQVLPGGVVPASTHVPTSGQRVPLFHCSACAVRTNSSGIRWKHASVSGSEAGHRRYW
jgi:hypothetical protein